MVELNYKTILGALLLVIVTSSGTYYLEKTTQYKSCQGLWVLQEDGQYQCSKTLDKQWCYSIESRGSGWYRCWIGKQVLVDEPKSTPVLDGNRLFCNGEWWTLQGDKSNPYAILINDNGNKQAYYSECVNN